MPSGKKSAAKGSVAKKKKRSEKATNKGGNRSTKKPKQETSQAWERGESVKCERYVQN